MISIIIPAWNEEKCLPILLDCIKRQSYKDYEIIVADADSTDKTVKIAKNFGCRMANSGGHPGVGRNEGAKIAKGKFLLFLDADVQISRTFLEDLMGEISKNNIEVAGTFIYPLSNKVIDRIFLGMFNCWIYATQYFYPNAYGGCIFCKKSVHQKINGFDEEIKLSEDMDYVKRAGKLGRFSILNSVKAGFSMRRYDNQGRFRVGFKLLMSGLYRLFFGEIRSNIFNYKMKYKR